MAPPLIRRLDLRGTACPMNFVRIKIAMDDLEPKTVLEAVVDPAPVSLEVERSLREQGYNVLDRVEGQGQSLIRVSK